MREGEDKIKNDYLSNSAKESIQIIESFIESLLEIIFEFDSPCAELEETLFSKQKKGRLPSQKIKLAY